MLKIFLFPKSTGLKLTSTFSERADSVQSIELCAGALISSNDPGLALFKIVMKVILAPFLLKHLDALSFRSFEGEVPITNSFWKSYAFSCAQVGGELLACMIIKDFST
jgi:hypothetical protein